MSAREGWLRLGIACYDKVTVASQIWMVMNGTAYIFKLAYDEDYKKLSPGTVLTSFMMEYVINTDAVSTIDYLSGDDNYKKDWMSLRRERHGMAAYNPSTLRGVAMLIGYNLKCLYKKLRGAR
jgi:CelD/BcsL family acetyltransferase involved in cellulose biosynthesis